MSTCFSFISEGGIVFHMNTPIQLKIRGHAKWRWTTSMVSRANTSPVNIGAGAFIAPGVIAAGVPCKVIRPIPEKDKFKPEDILFWELQIGNAEKTYVQALRRHFCFSPCFSAGRKHGILRATTRNLKQQRVACLIRYIRIGYIHDRTIKEAIIDMDTKTILLELRTQKGLSQDELAEKIFVSRQAVSRWESGVSHS